MTPYIIPSNATSDPLDSSDRWVRPMHKPLIQPLPQRSRLLYEVTQELGCTDPSTNIRCQVTPSPTTKKLGSIDPSTNTRSHDIP